MSSATTASLIHREPELVGQTVVVIGGSAGIGLETARHARGEGADVVLVGRDRDRLEQAAAEVNLIAAGFVDTPLSARLLGDNLEQRRDQLRATLPIRRVVGPADVAALAVHLMTNTALTGATYDIDGGQQIVPASSG